MVVKDCRIGRVRPKKKKNNPKKNTGKRQLRKHRPPDTERFCDNCQSMRVFIYSPFIGHSRCRTCKWRDKEGKG